MIYDIIILGGGPAASAAAVYAARKQMKVVVIAESFGGQSIVSNDVDNWIGDIRLSGAELAMKFEKHVKAQEELEIKQGYKATAITEVQSEPYPVYEVETDRGETFQGKTIFLGIGARRRKLQVPGEEEYTGRGVAYCATCDAPFFKDKKVAVVGGGNAGLESAVDLLAYASEVYLFERNDKLKGDPGTAEHMMSHPNFKEVKWKTAVREVRGETFIKEVTYEDLESGEMHTMELDGLFIEIGAIPNSEMVKDLVELNPYREVVIDHKYCTTSRPGIFAAGDVTDEAYKQNNISAGDAVKAALSANAYVQKLRQEYGE